MFTAVAPLLLASLAAFQQASAAPLDVDLGLLADVGKFVGLDVVADVHVGRDGIKAYVCLDGYILSHRHNPPRCLWNGPKPVKSWHGHHEHHEYHHSSSSKKPCPTTTTHKPTTHKATPTKVVKTTHKPTTHKATPTKVVQTTHKYTKPVHTSTRKSSYHHPKPTHTPYKPVKPCYPVHGRCPSGFRKHPLLEICISVEIDIFTDLGISQPHSLSRSGSCGRGWRAHPDLLDICIKVDVDFDLDLGHYGRRPNWHGACPSGFRSHGSILNLCILADIDINLFDHYLGRKFLQDGRCTAGWVPHPRVAGICVDAAVDISLFNNEYPLRNGGCQRGWKRHPLLDLCLKADVELLGILDIDLGVGIHL